MIVRSAGRESSTILKIRGRSYGLRRGIFSTGGEGGSLCLAQNHFDKLAFCQRVCVSITGELVRKTALQVGIGSGIDGVSPKVVPEGEMTA